MQIFKNLSLFSNAGVGEYGTNNISIKYNNETYSIKTILANELLHERAEIYRNNYKSCNMITGSITDPNIFNQIIENFSKNKPITGTFSPPCQGSSGLNAFKGNALDFRNQLVKSIFQIFEKQQDNNSLEYGYIENVVSYYKEEIPGLFYPNLDYKEPELLNQFIETNSGDFLNYKYFILTNQIESFEDLTFSNENIHLLKEDNFYKKTFCLGFNSFEELKGKFNFNSLMKYLKNNNNFDFSFISSITIHSYIEKSLNLYGYSGILKNIRGEEYGAPQIRQRGFFIFFKKELNFSFPKAPFNTSKNIKEYNGKNILDAFLVNDLIQVIDNNKANLLETKKRFKKKEILDFKIKDNKIYIDNSITIEKADVELQKWIKQNYPDNRLPSLHFSSDLKPRYKAWIENTPEGKSAYDNIHRHHRPYKTIKVIKTNDNTFQIKSDTNLEITEDTPQFFLKNKILDYALYIPEDMKKRTGSKEWGEGKRNWQIAITKDRKELENKIIQIAKDKLQKEKINSFYYVFFPIKGFQSTYKRSSFNKPANALTTKMGYSNSNTGHPLFDRVFTPAEVMSLFGLGYVIDDKYNYVKSSPYIPPKNISKITSFQKLIYEIQGEAIISLVSEFLLEDMTSQYLTIKT